MTSAPPILVVEPAWHGSFHMPFNAGVLEALTGGFSHRRVVFAAESAHGERVGALLPADVAGRVEHLDLEAPPFGDLWSKHLEGVLGQVEPVRAAWRARALIRRILQSQPDAVDLLLTSTTPATLVALRMPGLGRHGPRSVETIVHGALADLDGWRTRRPLRRALDLRSALSYWVRGGGSVTVLEHHIPEQAARRLPRLAAPGALKVFPHPTLDGPATEPGPPPTAPLRVGFLGAVTDAKGGTVFSRLAQELGHRPEIEFRLCGFLPGPESGIDLSRFHDPVSTELLPRAHYDEGVRRLHYVCLPLGGPYYDLAASGTVLDAVLHLKPLLTLDGPLTRRLFADAGDIGHLCADEDDLRATLQLLADGVDPHRYRRQVANLETLRESRRPAALAAWTRDHWFT